MFFLKGNRIGLRALEIEDIQGNYANWLNDEEVCMYNSHYRFPMYKEKLRDYVCSIQSNNGAIVLAIIDLKNNEHIGNISLQSINYIDKNAELAFVLGEKNYWGKGIAREAAELLIHHAFNQLNLERIYLGTLDENKRMIKLAERLGFVREGIRRRSLFKNGKYHDIVEFGLLKIEYEGEKGNE